MQRNNTIILRLLFCGLVLAAAAVSAIAQDPKETGVNKSKYKVGQVWSYKTRPSETKSTFIVVKVENDPKLGNIIHIAVRDLKIKRSDNPENYLDKVNHMPFTEEAIDKSINKLIKEKAELPDFESGYDLWREAFDEGRAGVYTITIAEAVSVTESTLNQ